MSGLKPKVTVEGEEAPRAKPTNGIGYEVDTAGRKIGAKKPTALDMFELTLLLGEHSGNSSALNQAVIAACVVEIDGEPLSRPVTVLELKARIQRLDFHGYLAANKAVEKLGEGDSGALKDAVKN